MGIAHAPFVFTFIFHNKKSSTSPWASAKYCEDTALLVRLIVKIPRPIREGEDKSLAL
jgi:hypothetical protein